MCHKTKPNQTKPDQTFYTYEFNTFLNEPVFRFFFHTVKWFHLFPYDMNNSIYY